MFPIWILHGFSTYDICLHYRPFAHSGLDLSLIRALRDRFFGRDWNSGPSQIRQTRFSGTHILIDSIDGLRQRARGFGQQTFRLDQHRFMRALTTRFHARRRRRPRLRRSFPVQTSADERGDRRSFGTHHPPFSGASAHSLTTWIVAFPGVSRLQLLGLVVWSCT